MSLICNARTATVTMKIIHISCLIGKYVFLESYTVGSLKVSYRISCFSFFTVNFNIISGVPRNFCSVGGAGQGGRLKKFSWGQRVERTGIWGR
jgi:hypothetical protein